MWAQNSSREGGGPSKMTRAPTCMWEARRSWCRNDASTGLRRSRWPCFSAMVAATLLGMRRLALVVAIIALVSCGDSPGAARVDRFDSGAAWRLLKQQVELGPRPAGSEASRRLA